MEKDKQLMNKLRSNHDQAMSNLKISHKQEQVLNKFGTSWEQCPSNEKKNDS